MLLLIRLYTNFSAFAQDEWKSVAAVESFLGIALGGESRARRHARVEALYDSRVKPQYLDAGTAGHAALADHLVQLCAPPGCCLHTP